MKINFKINKQLKRILQLTFLLLMSLILLLLPAKKIAKNQKIAKNESLKISPSPSPSSPLPVKTGNTPPPFLTAKAVVVADVASGEVLYAKNEDLPLWPASITKLMTALVSLEKYKLNEVLTVRNPLKRGRVMNLVAGEKITVENLLYGLLVYSANDAAYVLAENYPGGLSSFVAAMNKKALALNLENTHFENPAGFDNNKQYTTASDLQRLSLFALKNPQIAKIVGTVEIVVSDVDFTHFHRLRNVNELLGKVPGVAGVKTGWTENAKENLVNLTKRNGREILTVVLRSEDRFGETEALINWVFANFSWKSSTSQAKKGQ